MIGMQTLPAKGTKCARCEHHLATVILDLGDDQPEVPTCGVCALGTLLDGLESGANRDGRAGSSPWR